ncbi:Lrp/AsnC family transcriptional regulator [Erythrobacter sp. NE805]|uniref:Lrp/AsnC family transcriptional regulator n=1 Tax=Erythrobacter sp. NE805 TaxID=3389875 RepID=UPI00396B26B9
MRTVPESGTLAAMLDDFDRALLTHVQRDDGATAEELATRVALSPSAIARRLRRLRRDGWIAATIALLSPRLTERRLRAVVALQLAEHADLKGKRALLDRLAAAPQVQFCYELAGAVDLQLLLDCRDMAEFNALVEALFESDGVVRRYETSFVKRAVKFAPFIDLAAPDSAA